MSEFKIKPRSEWTSTPEGFSHALTAANVRGVVIHYPGDGDVTRLGISEERNEQLIAAYWRYHTKSRGWSDIGYNFAVSQSGLIWSAAGRKKAAHCASTKNPYANYYYVGILQIRGNHEAPSPAMIAATNWLIQQINGWYGISETLGHREVYGASTDCPGDEGMAPIKSGLIGLNGSTSVGAAASATSGSKTTTTSTAKKNSHAHRAYAAGEVLAIQKKLRAAGFYGGLLDDDYGPATEAAVLAYQTAQLWPAGYLAKDGDWGPATEAHYQWVVTLQKALNEWKSTHPDLVVDGSYGALTARRVLDVQTRNYGGAYKGARDGVPGSVTCAMLGIPTHP